MRNWKKNVLGITISFLCLGFIAYRIDLVEVRDAMSQFQWVYLLLGVLSLAFGYTMRIVRWGIMLRAAGANITFAACAVPFLGSIALNNTLPLRAGDVVRALIFPSAIGVGKTTATGSLIMERLVDLLTLLACLAIGLAISANVDLPNWLETTAVSLAILSVIMLTMLFLFSGRLSRWCNDLTDEAIERGALSRGHVIKTLGNLLGSFENMSRLPVLILLSALSMLVWIGEAGLFWALLLGFMLDAGPAFAVIVMAIATLSTLIPSSPGYVGPFHLAAFTAISMLGGTDGQAASFAVVSHLGVWLPTTLVGALAIFINPQLFASIKVKTASSQNY